MARKPGRGKASKRAAARVAVKGPSASKARSKSASRARTRSKPQGGGKRLRDLTRLTATLEIFTDEVQHTYRKWLAEQPRSREQRQRCSKDLRLLAAHGDSTLLQYRDVRLVILTDGGTTAEPKEDSVSAAFEIAEDAGCEQIIELLIDLLLAVADRMDVPYTAETQSRFADDAREMNKLVQMVRTIGNAVRERCRDDVPRLPLPNPVRNALDSLKDRIRLSLSDMTGRVGDTAEPERDIDRRVAAMIDRAKGVAGDCRNLKFAIAPFVKQHLDPTKRIDISLANEIDYLLETVQSLAHHANAVVEFAASHLEAACTLGLDIPRGARELAAALREMRDAHEALRAMLVHQREIVAQSPYRCFRRTKPLPEWDAIAVKDREVVAALVQLRHGDPDGERAWATQVMIETEMRKTGGRPPSSSVFKALVRLEDDFQIVGSYPMPRSNQQQHGVNHLWINEDAFAKYGPHVLGHQ